MYAVDLQKYNDDSWRLASAGADNTIKLWQVSHSAENHAEGTAIKFLSELTRHTGTVNCVRFSPDGTKLASASDDATILIWTLDTDRLNEPEDEIGSIEHWRMSKMLRLVVIAPPQHSCWMMCMYLSDLSDGT